MFTADSFNIQGNTINASCSRFHPMNIEMGLGVLFSTTCAFLVLCGCGVDAYATRSGYARPADLFGGENGRSGSAFGASESVQAQTAASYARPASVTANGGGYQPISGANGYSYGNGGYANSQYPAAGNGKRKPVGFGGEANGVGYGGYTSAPSGYPAAGSYAGGAAAPSYARPASVPFSGGEHNGAQGPSVPASEHSPIRSLDNPKRPISRFLLKRKLYN